MQFKRRALLDGQMSVKEVGYDDGMSSIHYMVMCAFTIHHPIPNAETLENLEGPTLMPLSWFVIMPIHHGDVMYQDQGDFTAASVLHLPSPHHPPAVGSGSNHHGTILIRCHNRTCHFATCHLHDHKHYHYNAKFISLSLARGWWFICGGRGVFNGGGLVVGGGRGGRSRWR